MDICIRQEQFGDVRQLRRHTRLLASRGTSRAFCHWTFRRYPEPMTIESTNFWRSARQSCLPLDMNSMCWENVSSRARRQSCSDLASKTLAMCSMDHSWRVVASIVGSRDGDIRRGSREAEGMRAGGFYRLCMSPSQSPNCGGRSICWDTSSARQVRHRPLHKLVVENVEIFQDIRVDAASDHLQTQVNRVIHNRDPPSISPICHHSDQRPLQRPCGVCCCP